MLNLIRKFLRPTLREQLEAGVRDALRRYSDRRTAPDLRVYISEDLLPEGVEPNHWARDESDHLRRFATQWAEDNNIVRAGMGLEMVLLDTKREFAFVKPLGLAEPESEPPSNDRRAQTSKPPSNQSRRPSGSVAVLEVVRSPDLAEPLMVEGELTLGRKPSAGVQGLGDRYMSARHAHLRVDQGRLWLTDLDSKNRTFLNDEPLEPHREYEVGTGDTVRMGTTSFRVLRFEG